jgi:hypothetical protein
MDAKTVSVTDKATWSVGYRQIVSFPTTGMGKSGHGRTFRAWLVEFLMVSTWDGTTSCMQVLIDVPWLDCFIVPMVSEHPQVWKRTGSNGPSGAEKLQLKLTIYPSRGRRS